MVAMVFDLVQLVVVKSITSGQSFEFNTQFLEKLLNVRLRAQTDSVLLPVSQLLVTMTDYFRSENHYRMSLGLALPNLKHVRRSCAIHENFMEHLSLFTSRYVISLSCVLDNKLVDFVLEGVRNPIS